MCQLRCASSGVHVFPSSLSHYPIWFQKCVTALDQTWHPDHFFCTQCGCQFGEDGFQEKDGKPYCKEDYLAMFALKCKGCTTAITEGYISALNGQWHPQCFVCRVSWLSLRAKVARLFNGSVGLKTHSLVQSNRKKTQTNKRIAALRWRAARFTRSTRAQFAASAWASDPTTKTKRTASNEDGNQL